MYLKNGRVPGAVQKGTTSRVMVASKPKVSFWPDGSTNPGNYGYHHVAYVCVLPHFVSVISQLHVLLSSVVTHFHIKNVCYIDSTVIHDSKP
jgi:hypothetical protein